MDDFGSFRSNSTKRFATQKAKRLELRNGVDTDQLTNTEEIEYTVQFLVESKKEEVAAE